MIQVSHGLGPRASFCKDLAWAVYLHDIFQTQFNLPSLQRDRCVNKGLNMRKDFSDSSEQE